MHDLRATADVSNRAIALEPNTKILQEWWCLDPEISLSVQIAYE
ncbi:MAG TPA: hypothetical protein ACFE0H_11955 [Elainellaceae cyanobacterium]|jgi:hypothetical protein